MSITEEDRRHNDALNAALQCAGFRKEAPEAQSTPPAEDQPASPRFTVKRAADVQEGEIKFLWEPYFLRGDVTIVAAAGGTGKTFALCGIAAFLSTGEYPQQIIPKHLAAFNVPREFLKFDPARILFISAEDPAFMLRDRLMKAGANMDNVFILDATDSMNLTLSNAQHQPDMTGLESCIDQCNPDMVVIDPLHAFIGSGVKMTEQSAIRPFMQALANLAKKHNCAIVDVAHVSKRTAGNNANDAILGATDIVNASRSVLRVIGDETGTNPNRRVIVHTKSNYAAAGDSPAFEISKDGVLSWIGFADVNRDDLEAAARNNKSVPEYLENKAARARADVYVADQLETLAKQQTEKRRFYSWETLREHGVTNKAAILPCMGELNRRRITVMFPDSPLREHPTDKYGKRGIELIRA